MSSVRVRMYRQGLGDCFLLTLSGRERESNVLIDFGVLLGTKDAKPTMRKIAQQIVEATRGRLDVLVATHEHWDHVSGFMQAEDLLGRDKLEVGKVWLAWTEKPNDPLAMELDKRRARALKRVVTARQKLMGVADAGAKRTIERWTGCSNSSVVSLRRGAGQRAARSSGCATVPPRTRPNTSSRA